MLIKTSGIAIPADLSEKVFEQQKQQEEKALKRQASLTATASARTTSAGSGELKDLKIKLSHKDREIK